MRRLFVDRDPLLRVSWWWVVAICALIACAFVRTAAVTEDAFITFRVIDNALHGYGLVWNVGERVQPYTHPLWLLLLWPIAAITGELFHTSLALSLGLTVIAAALIARYARSRNAALWALLTLLFSESFIEYSGAALENALAHALIAGFVIAYKFRADRAWIAALCAGLLIITRHDFAVLVAPALIALWWRENGRVRWQISLASALPLLAWSAFAIIYYGSPWPNSAFAKLNNGMTLFEAARTALPYFRDLAKYDAVTALTLVAAIGLGILRGAWRVRSIAIGIALYIAYLLSAGGDYMGGRLFSAPFVAAVALIASNVALQSRWLATALFALVAGLGLHRGWIVWDVHPHAQVRTMSQHAWTYPHTGWLSHERRADFSTMPWAAQGDAAKKEAHRVVAKCAVGLYGFTAGPAVYIVDPLALADPFLSRLPAKKPAYPGHFERSFPAGYIDSKITGTAQLTDPSLAKLYSLTELVSRAPLFADDRLQAIWALNTGQSRALASSANYDPNATFAPGMATTSRERLSCMGQFDPLLTVRLK
jgi:arabinofuranosyltransferase